MSDALRGWNMIRKAWLDGTGKGINDMSPEDLEKFMGLGDRAKLKTSPGVGSIQDRVASEAERRASKSLKDAEIAEMKNLELVQQTQAAGADLIGFLSVVKAGETEMMGQAAQRVRDESQSMADFLVALGDAPIGLAQEQSNRFSDLRRMGANELGTGLPNRGQDKQQAMIDLLRKQVDATGKIPDAIRTIGNFFGVFI